MVHQPAVCIESIGVYLPANVVPVAETLASCTKPLIFPFEALTGIHSVRAARGEFGIDLACKAIVDCLTRSRYQPEDIGLLICASISKRDGTDKLHSLEPSVALRLRADLGLENAIAFDLMNACPGMFTAIKVIEAFIAVGAIRCGMVVSGEYITHLTQTAVLEIDGFMDPRLACLTLGDAGAAVIIDAARDQGVGFREIDLYTLGEYSSLCIGKASPGPHGGGVMYTDGAKLNPPALANSASHASQMLSDHEWHTDYIQHIIPHQTSSKTLTDAGKEIDRALGRKGFSKLVTMNNLGERGNTATTSHFVAVMDGINQGRIRSGDNAVFVATGSGLTVGAALYTFDDLPDRIRGSARSARLEREPAASSNPRPSSHNAGVTTRVESVATVPASWTGPRETVSLATAAAQSCLQRVAADPATIRLLIYCGVYRTEGIVEPAIAAMVAGALGLNRPEQVASSARNLAFDITDSGLGFMSACHAAALWLKAEGGGRALIVSSEVEFNQHINVAPPRGVVETGAAMLLCATPTERSGDSAAGFERALFRTNTQHLGAFEAYISRRDSEYFACVRDSALEAQYLEEIPLAVVEFLKREELSRDEIDWVLVPQLSSKFIAALSQRLAIDRTKFVDVSVPGRDLFTCAFPRALEALVASHDSKPRQLCLFVSAGAGIRVGCTSYRLDR